MVRLFPTSFALFNDEVCLNSQRAKTTPILGDLLLAIGTVRQASTLQIIDVIPRQTPKGSEPLLSFAKGRRLQERLVI